MGWCYGYEDDEPGGGAASHAPVAAVHVRPLLLLRTWQRRQLSGRMPAAPNVHGACILSMLSAELAGADAACGPAGGVRAAPSLRRALAALALHVRVAAACQVGIEGATGAASGQAGAVDMRQFAALAATLALLLVLAAGWAVAVQAQPQQSGPALVRFIQHQAGTPPPPPTPTPTPTVCTPAITPYAGGGGLLDPHTFRLTVLFHNTCATSVRASVAFLYVTGRPKLPTIWYFTFALTGRDQGLEGTWRVPPPCALQGWYMAAFTMWSRDGTTQFWHMAFLSSVTRAC